MQKNRLLKTIIIIITIILLLYIHRTRIVLQVTKVAQKVPVLQRTFNLSEDPIAYKTDKEYQSIISDNEKEIEDLEKQLLEQKQLSQELEEQVIALQTYQDEYEQFRIQKNAFDQSVAATNPDYFIDYYEKMFPEDAAKIYSILKEEQLITIEQQDYVNTVTKMDEVSAAGALQILVDDDPDLVKYIVQGMKTDRRASILDNMTSDYAAKVIQLLEPESR